MSDEVEEYLEEFPLDDYEEELYPETDEERWERESEEAAEYELARIEGSLHPTDYKLRLYSERELRRIRFPNPPMLIESFLPRGGVGIIHGTPGIGKSALAATLARAVAEGDPFLGHQTHKGKVVYLQIDMTVQVQHDRLLKQADIPESRNLYYVLGVMKNRIENWKVIAKEDWVGAVRNLEPDLIIIDTLRDFHGMNENDSETPTAVFKNTKKLLGDKPTLVFVHHDRKAQEGDFSSAMEHIRGSIAWAGGADVAIRVVGKGAQLRANFTKVRTCEPQDDVFLYLNSDTLLMEINNDNPGQRAKSILKLAPNISKKDFVEELIATGTCKISRAYELATELGVE